MKLSTFVGGLEVLEQFEGDNNVLLFQGLAFIIRVCYPTNPPVVKKTGNSHFTTGSAIPRTHLCYR